MVSLLSQSEAEEMGQWGRERKEKERERRHDSQRPQGGPKGD